MQLLKFLCDAQFTRNNSFKNQMNKLLEEGDSWMREGPVGLDKKGLRYWLLQVMRRRGWDGESEREREFVEEKIN